MKRVSASQLWLRPGAIGPVWLIVLDSRCALGAASYARRCRPPAIATVGRSSAVRLYVTFFYIGGSAGAVLPGLAWDLRAGPRQSRFAYFTDPNGERRRIGLAAMSIATVGFNS